LGKTTSNNNLIKASQSKKDEYYTQMKDIEKELQNYHECFQGKTIYCNCDNPEKSNFFKYFFSNFKKLKLKKLITTHIEHNKLSYKQEVILDTNEENLLLISKTTLAGDGDFRSDECIEILKDADILVTNPPFSLFREYMSLLIKENKKFLIIGNINAISYGECFKEIKKNKLWLGYNNVRHFYTPDGSLYETARSFWYTNLDTNKRHISIKLHRTYQNNESEYPKYDNYCAINVDKTIDIPLDYKGTMGVPITFMSKYNPKQFEIIGQMATTKINEFNYGYPYIDGKKKYARILIKHKDNSK